MKSTHGRGGATSLLRGRALLAGGAAPTGEANRTQRLTTLLALQEETKALPLLEEVRALEVEDT